MTMEQPSNKAKIRFKFRTGEEFEAEGNPDFIAQQRAEFLQLIGKDGALPTPRRLSPRPAPTGTTFPTEIHPAQPAPGTNARSEAYITLGDTLPPSEIWPQKGGISRGISAAETRQAHHYWAPAAGTSSTDVQLWEQIARTEGRLVYLRRKSRQLSAETTALVLIAAAKVLLRASDGYSALLLSKSLKKSGYGGERLDRVLAGEMRQKTVWSEGTKRSRAYLLSDEGFARAYVLATKLAEEWQF